MERCSFLHFSHFPLDLPSGFDFGPSWPPFCSGSGRFFLFLFFVKIFYASKADQKIFNFLHQFFYEFCSILEAKMAPGRATLTRKSLPSGVQDHLDEVALIAYLSYLCFGSFLGRFWHDFGSVFR